MPEHLTAEALATTLRPLTSAALRALEQILVAGAVVPTRPVSRFEVEADGGSRQWVEADVDWQRLEWMAIGALSGSSDLFAAEAVIAEALGTGPHERRPGEQTWTPQGEVVREFLARFIRRLTQDAENARLPEALVEPDDRALDECVRELAEFLAKPQFSGELLAPLQDTGVEGSPVELEQGVGIRAFTADLRAELWSSHGWGSLSLQPLELHDLLDMSHIVAVTVGGGHLGGWNWAGAQSTVERVLLALRLNGRGSVAAPLAWLRPPEPFGGYLARLGAGGGLVRSGRKLPRRGRLTLTPDGRRTLVSSYRSLTRVPANSSLQLALRRLESSYERATDEDRLIDTWIAFEALVAPDQTTELRFRASLRIARLLGRDPTERFELFETMKRSYDWRSHIVHGGGKLSAKKQRELGTLSDAVTSTEQALRGLLRSWIDHPDQTVAEIDEKFLR